MQIQDLPINTLIFRHDAALLSAGTCLLLMDTARYLHFSSFSKILKIFLVLKS